MRENNSVGNGNKSPRSGDTRRKSSNNRSSNFQVAGAAARATLSLMLE